MSMPNFEDLNGQKLVDKYNWMADLIQVRHIKKFESRDIGLKRCRSLHKQLLERNLVEEEAAPKGDAVPTVAAPAAAPTEAEAPMPAAKAKVKVSAKPARPASDRMSMRIKLTVKDNPRRPGTDAHKFYQSMTGGITVGRYSDKFKTPEERRKALQWLSNTVRDGFAKVVP